MAFTRRFQQLIHVKLPTTLELSIIIENKLDSLKNVNHNVLTPEIQLLAHTCTGFTPFDVEKLIQEVVSKKIKQFRLGQHFEKDQRGFWYMIEEKSTTSTSMTYKEVRKLNFKLPIISRLDLVEARKSIHATNAENDDEQFKDFCKKSGCCK